jgi:hypothetical protein
MRTTTHSNLVAFHKAIADAHKEINGFYRFNWNEINGQFRSGIGVPALLLESHSAQLSTNSNNTTTFNNKNVSFLLLDFTGKVDDYNSQEAVLDKLENVVLDIAAYLKKENGNRDSWLYGKFDTSSFQYEKVGPIFDNMYGWNILYAPKNQEPLCYEAEKWDWPI